jgi:phosphomannomutase
MSPDIFKAYDVRGRVGTELNSDTVFCIGQAFSETIKPGSTVVVGHDMRVDSRTLAEVFMTSLSLSGCKVIDIGLVTSDMAVFAVKHFAAEGAAIITASHNGEEYSGIKIYDSTPKTVGLDQGLDIIRDKAVVLYSQNVRATDAKAAVEKTDITDQWIDFCLSIVDSTNFLPLNMAIDCGNGMAGHILPHLLTKLPFTSTNLYFDLDGTFPNHDANPQKLSTLTDLIKVVREKRLDLGLAFDGDGDRMAMVDNLGVPISGSEMIGILSSSYPAGSKVVYDVRTSKKIINDIEESGKETIRSKAGRSNIGFLMRQIDAEFGGETTGHFFFKDYYFNDSGLISMLKALEVICSSGNKLSELRKQFATDPMIEETNFEVKDADDVLSRLTEHFSEYVPDMLDGLTVVTNRGWFNVRKSNTEPLVRLNMESSTIELRDSLYNEVVNIIKE